MNSKEFGQKEFNNDQFLAGGITLLFTGMIGFVGNVLVLAVTYRIFRHRRNVPNVLILFLAWTDLLVFPLAYPQSLIKYFFGVYVGNYMACDLQATAITFLFMVSILLVAIMSIDRMLALYTPFCYERHVAYDKEKIKVTAIGFGCSALTVSLLPAFGVGRNVLHFPGTFCLFQWRAETVDGKSLVYIFMSILAASTFVIIVGNLVVVIMALRLVQRRQENTPRGDVESVAKTGKTNENHLGSGEVEIQFVKLSCAVTVAFVCCWGLFLVSN